MEVMILMKPFKMKIRWLVFIAIIISLYACGENSEENGVNKSILTPVDVLPGDNDISGWESLGAYEEANDYDSLYALINGGAEVFIDQGFVSSAFQQYNNCVGGACSAAIVYLRIYDQGSSENAQSVYDKIATGIGIPWDGAGFESRIDESALASYTVEFWQRNFFVQVIIDEKTDESLNVVKLFATQVSNEIG
jgi:hypothetical protein